MYTRYNTYLSLTAYKNYTAVHGNNEVLFRVARALEFDLNNATINMGA